LLQKDNTPKFAASAALFQSFNFAMLKVRVQDMNHYDESSLEDLKYLDVSVDSVGDEKFKVKLLIRGKNQENASSTRCGKPISEVVRICNVPDEDKDSKYHHFIAKNLVK